ncbi:hypothetical protein N2152v2_008565 [Parachlorella kessleri]
MLPTLAYTLWAALRLHMQCRRKQQQVQGRLKELGEEGLEERLQMAGESPANPPHRLAKVIQDCILSQGKACLVLELSRSGGSMEGIEQLAQRAKRYAAAGADALALRTDADYTPEGLKDLWSVCRAVKVVDAKEAGAAGVVGVVSSVLARGTPIMSSFAASIGLDCPVEVVNAAGQCCPSELREAAKWGVPFYGIGLSVGLSVGIPGFARDVTHGLLGELPFGAISLVGVTSLDEARTAKQSGADALLIKAELVEEYKGRIPQLLEQLRYVTSGDD